MPELEIVRLLRTGTAPGQVVLRQQGALRLGCGAGGIANHSWLINCLAPKPTVQLVIVHFTHTHKKNKST